MAKVIEKEKNREEITKDDFIRIVNEIKSDIKTTRVKTMLQANGNLISFILELER